MKARDPALVDRIQEYFSVDKENKAVERVRRSIALVILRVDGPNCASEYTFFGFEMMIADCSREWRELTVLRWERGTLPGEGLQLIVKYQNNWVGLSLGSKKVDRRVGRVYAE